MWTKCEAGQGRIADENLGRGVAAESATTFQSAAALRSSTLPLFPIPAPPLSALSTLSHTYHVVILQWRLVVVQHCEVVAGLDEEVVIEAPASGT